jgi:hypothetical protein
MCYRPGGQTSGLSRFNTARSAVFYSFPSRQKCKITNSTTSMSKSLMVTLSPLKMRTALRRPISLMAKLTNEMSECSFTLLVSDLEKSPGKTRK